MGSRGVSEVWIDDGHGSRTRVWPPPWSADVPPQAAADARKAFELLARSAKASREEAVRQAERDLAAASRWEQRGDRRNREQPSRGDRRRQRNAPPMEAAAWRRWTDDFGCVARSLAACTRATGPAAGSPRAREASRVFGSRSYARGNSRVASRTTAALTACPAHQAHRERRPSRAQLAAAADAPGRASPRCRRRSRRRCRGAPTVFRLQPARRGAERAFAGDHQPPR